MIVSLGCVSLSEYITPAEKDNNAIRYVENSGVATAKDFDGYFNLDKARKLNYAVDAAHQMNQMELEQAIQKDNLNHAVLKETVYNNYQSALRNEEQLFGEGGILPLVAGLAGFGGLGGLIGLMRRRPGDWSQEEVDRAMADVTGKTAEQLSDKERQFSQLVKGMAEFAKTFTPEQKVQFKVAMDSAQDTDCQIAVATVKKEWNL